MYKMMEVLRDGNNKDLYEREDSITMFIRHRAISILRTPFAYFIFGVFMHSFPCAGQVIAERQLFRDSLHQHISRELRAELSCYFAYPQGSSVISANLGGNAAELDKLDAFVRQALSHPDYSVSRIRLTGYSSIEGDYARNEALSRDRVEYFHSYLQVRYPELYRYPHSVAWVAEDWQGLSRLVRSSSLNEREEILEIIRKVRVYDDREMLLGKLNGGHAYRIMEHTMFPNLRRVELQIEYQHAPKAETVTVDPLIYGVLDENTANFQDNRSLALANEKATVAQSGLDGHGQALAMTSGNRAASGSLSFGEGWGEAVGSRGEAVRPLFALKTNLLQWVGVQPDFTYTTPVANVALEYYINSCLSVELGAMYSYWRFNSNQEFQGISGYRLEPRYRFALPVWGERFGVYLGAYARFGDYDLRTLRSIENGELRIESYDTGTRLHADDLLPPPPPTGTPPRAGGESMQSVLDCRASLAMTGAQPALNSPFSILNSSTGDYWDAGISAGFTIDLVGGFGLEVGARAGYVSTKAIKYIKDGDYNWYDGEQKYNKVKVTDLNVSLVYRFR